jgi:hypothetical protein
MENFISRIDTQRFGFPVANFSNNIENPLNLVQGLKKYSVKLIIARIDLKNTILINQLEKIGFTYKDVQVTFNFNLKNQLPDMLHNDFLLTTYKDKHLPQLIEITKHSFANYGHYSADDKLPKEKCLEIYIDWIQRCSDDREVADKIIIAENDGIAIGYLALKTHNTEKEQYISGVIGAVSHKFRNKGVFQAINIESIYLSAKLGANRIENNVLVTNLPVMRAYTNLSFNIIRSEITMHYWYE